MEWGQSISPYLWLISVSCVLVVIIEKARRKRPCFLFGHRKRYVAITREGYWSSSGKCSDPNHFIHVAKDRDGITRYVKCTLSHWVCSNCESMGVECLGGVDTGAWKIEHERVVPDEKKWASGLPSDEEMFGPQVASTFWS